MEKNWEARWNKLITLGLICTAIYFVVVYVAHYNNVYFQSAGKLLGAAATLTILTLSGMVLYFAGKWGVETLGRPLCSMRFAEWKMILLVVVLAVFPRLAGMQVIQFPLESDSLNLFQYAQAYAETGEMPVSGYYLAIVPNTVLYTTLMGLLFRVFGTELTVALMMNLVIFAVAAVFFYLALRRILPQGISVLGAMLFCCNPMFLYYSLVLSIEPFGAMFLMIGLYLYLGWDASPDEAQNVTVRTVFLALACGAALSATNFTRPNAFILLIAIAISAVMRPRKHRFVLFAAVLAGYLLFGEVLNSFRDEILGVEVAGLGFGWTLFEGLDPTSYGVWTPENTTVLLETLDRYPYDEVQGVLLQLALERASTFDLATWIDLICGKGGNVWASCGDFVEMNFGTSVLAFGYEMFHLLEMTAYIVLVFAFTKCKLYRRLDTHLLVLYLFPVGMMILHSFATSIHRYRYLPMPFVYAAALMMLYTLCKEEYIKKGE